MLKLSIKEKYTDDSKRNSIFNNLNSLFYSNSKSNKKSKNGYFPLLKT
jgi:hypothetical protein